MNDYIKRVMVQDRVLILSGNLETAAALTDLLSESYELCSIGIDQDTPNYHFGLEQRSILLKAGVILIDIPSIKSYTPLLLSYLKSLNKEAPIILLHHYTEKTYAKNLLKTGAIAYLPINFQPEELKEAIRYALLGLSFSTADQEE